jgi:hypothetical protein
VPNGDVVATSRRVLPDDVGDAELFAAWYHAASMNAAIASSIDGSSVM